MGADACNLSSWCGTYAEVRALETCTARHNLNADLLAGGLRQRSPDVVERHREVVEAHVQALGGVRFVHEDQLVV